jgi:hypothetical protein
VLQRFCAGLGLRGAALTARLGTEDVTASRTLESGSILGQHPLVDSVAGVTTGALDLDHRRNPSSPAKR